MNKTHTITYSVNLDGEEIIEGKVFSFNATPNEYLDTLKSCIKDIKKEVQRDFKEQGENYKLSQITVKVWY